MRRIPLAMSSFTLLVLAFPVSAAESAGADGRDERALAREIRNRLREEELRRPELDPSDLVGKAAELGGDPARIFAFVGGEVAFEPYQGLLRGPRGTLVCRAGNSLDKSLLLNAMLSASGRRSRLVKGTLTPAQAEILVAKYLGQDPLAGPLGDYRLPADEEKEAAVCREFAERAALRPEFVRELFARASGESQRLEEGIREAAQAELGRLRSEVDLRKLTKTKTAAAWVQELQARAAEHYWVQIAAGGEEESWQDLDATFPGLKPGESATEASEVTEKDLQEARHFVVFKLLYRTQGGGEELLLEVPLAADEALFELPSLDISPAENVMELSKLVAMDAGKILEVFRGAKKFQGTLQSGGKSYASKAFDFEGNTFAVAEDGRVQAARQIGSALGKIFSGLGDEGGAAKPSFLSLDAEISFEWPGATARTHRRTLFSQQDAAKDSSRLPILTWEILIQPQPFTVALAIRGGLKATLSAWKPVLEVLDAPSGAEPALDDLASRMQTPFPAALAAIALLREKNLSDALAADRRLRLLWDRPNVMVFERKLAMRPGDCCFSSELLVDLVENAVGFVPVEAAAEVAALDAVAAQGVFDTVAEAMALGESFPGGIVRSPISVFERARLTGARWVSIEADGAVETPALTRADAEWVRAHEPGCVIIAPAMSEQDGVPGGAAGVQGAWWSLDPETGALVGRFRGGAGGALVEYWSASAPARFVLGVAWCVADMAWDQQHGDQKYAGERLVAKFGRCVVFGTINLMALGAPGSLAGAIVKFGASVLSNVAINWAFGGKGIVGSAFGGITF